MNNSRSESAEKLNYCKITRGNNFRIAVVLVLAAFLVAGFIGLPKDPFSLIASIKKSSASKKELLLPISELSDVLAVNVCDSNVLKTAYDSAANFQVVNSGLKVFRNSLNSEYKSDSKSLRELARQALFDVKAHDNNTSLCVLPLKISANVNLATEIPVSKLLEVSVGKESVICSEARAYLSADTENSKLYSISQSLVSYAGLLNTKKTVPELKRRLEKLQSSKARGKAALLQKEKQIRETSLALAYAQYFLKDALILASFYDSICSQAAAVATPAAKAQVSFNFPTSSTVKIMPLGDSITYGFNGIGYPNGSIPGGYRRELGRLLSAAGISYDFVGASTGNSAPGMDPHHNGYPGIRTDQVLSNIASWLQAAPDVVLIHLGTNDLIQAKPISTAVNNLRTLIQQIRLNAPNRIVYVSTIIPIIDTRDNHTPAEWAVIIAAYNAQVRSLVATLGSNVRLVDMNALLTYTFSNPINNFFQRGDGTHPGLAGYNQMATLWFNAMSTSGVNPPTPTPVSGPQVLVNGSFESDFASWSKSGNLGVQSSGSYIPIDGAKLVAFNTGNSAANGQLSQTFLTTAGVSYTLSFDAGVLSYNNSEQRLQVTARGSTTLLSQNISITGSGNGTIWRRCTFSFVADSAATTLTFSDQSTTTQALDLLLDNVRVTGGSATPPPTPTPIVVDPHPTPAGSLINGSFESGVAGWTSSGNQSIASAAPYIATNGSRLLAFNDGDRIANAVLSQSFSTVAGRTYTLMFDAGVLSYNSNIQTLQVAVNGHNSLLTRTISIAGSGGGSTRWVPQSFSFVADSTSTTLVFRDQSAVTNSLDLLLDNVRVQ